MNNNEWSEIQVVQLESRHELTLSGDKIAEKVSKNEGMVDESLFNIGKQLNYLKLSKIGLSKISPKISYLSQLTQLSIINNNVIEIPLEMSLLINLVHLDLSDNNITNVPDIFSNFSKLRTLNLRNNEISEILSFKGLVALLELFLDHNRLSCVPDDTFSLNQLMVLDLSSNQIVDIPSKIFNLKNLKNLNLEGNCINSVLPELGHMPRLKQLQLQNNPLKNVKTQLKKLINDNLYKAISEHLKRLDTNTSKTSRKHNSSSTKSESTPEEIKSINILNEDSFGKIILKNRPNLSRSQVVYFIVHNILLTQDKMKKFIKFQEQLHKSDGDNRKLVTIGTHDLSTINFPLTYSSKPSNNFSIQMINRAKPESGKLLYERLIKEADRERKMKKRGNVTGVYQYLYMINIDESQGVIEDCNGVIVSYPPLTNCNMTKVSIETTDLLIEVIGTKLDKCKVVSETIIRWLIENEFSNTDSYLEIEPVRVYEDNSELSADSGQNLLVVFPSRTDLNTLGYAVIRP